MKRFHFLFFLFFSAKLMAFESQLLTISEDVDNGEYTLNVISSDDIKDTKLQLIDHVTNQVDLYSMTQLNKGIVLKESSGHKVIILRCENILMTPESNNVFTLDYLRSGLSGKRGELLLVGKFDGEKWSVYQKGNQVTHLDFIGKKILGKVIGIKNIIAR